jgi:hypothetical protein
LGDGTSEGVVEAAGDWADGTADEWIDELAAGLVGLVGGVDEAAWVATLEKTADIPDDSCCSFAC